MKKPLLFSTALIALDQAVKLIIFHLCPAADTVILPGILFFRPVQNTNLS